MKLRRLVGWAATGISLVGAGVLGAIRDYRYGGDLVWAPGYKSALSAAQSAHRPILISFHSTGCDWCRKMDTETFTNPHVVALSHDYICVRADALRDPELIQRYHVVDYPTTVISDEHGRTLEQMDGYTDADAMAGVLEHNLAAQAH